MSALIKPEAQGARPVLAFGASAAAAVQATPTAAELLEARIAALEAERAEADRRLPELIASARAEAKREALASAERDEAGKLELLKYGMERALKDWREGLADLDGVAAHLSGSILEKIFGEDERRSGLVTAALKRRLGEIEAASLLRLRVSSKDFGEESALERLRAMLGPGLSIDLDEKLDASECAIDLKLGEVEAGPGAQWRRVKAYLAKIEHASA